MDITHKVTRIIVDELGVEAKDVTPTAAFHEDLGADSLDRIEMMMACEVEFGIDISDGDAERIRTVGELVAYIEQRTQQQASATT